MGSDIMESILWRLESKMCQEKRKVVLFWANATYYPETLQASLTNVKLVFLPKNTTSRLQPLDAGIIRNFKHKYRKLLVPYVISCIDEGKTVYQIIEDVHVESDHLASNRLEKWTHGDHQPVLQKMWVWRFTELFAQLSRETALGEYIDFDAETMISDPAVNSTHLDWRQEGREESIAEVL